MRQNMNENTLTTSLGTPNVIQFDTVAGGNDIVLTFEVHDKETSEDENYSHTIWTKWDGIEDNISTTRDDWSD
tara:strand:- start:632 stop:850 length:219 start_codon:yes stop_codon:yes gene_type:complete